MKRILIAGVLVEALLTVSLLLGAGSIFATSSSKSPPQVLAAPNTTDNAAEPRDECPPDWLEITAKIIGMELDNLWEALDRGQTIAQVAQSHGVDPQTIQAAIIAAETRWADNMVASRELTRAEASEGLATLPEDIQVFLNAPADWMCDEDDAWSPGPDWLEVAAKAVGMDIDTFFGALTQADSIARVAQTNGIDPQTVQDAIVTAMTEWINAQVSKGVLTSKEADEWLASLAREVQDFIDSNIESCGGCNEGTDWIAVAAETIGMDTEALVDALNEGQTIAGIARSHGVDPQTVIDAIVTAETTAVQEWLTQLPEEVRAFVEEDWGADLALDDAEVAP